MRKETAQREMIVARALEKFRVHGFRRVSMSEIARDLRISKKTIYQHFKNKEDLVRASIEKNLEHIFPPVASALTSDDPVPERLYATWQALSRVPTLISEEMMEDVRSDYPHLWQLIQERKDTVLSQYEKIIADGISSGEVRTGINPRVAVLTILAISNTILTPQTILNENFSIAETIKTIGTMIMNGIFNSPPDFEQMEENND